MPRKIVALVLVLGLLLGSLAAVRASRWTPVAPARLPATAWEPLLDPEPSHWQTLDHVEFESGGGTFVAELQGYRRLTSGAEHSFVVRIVRTGGAEAALAVSGGSLDSVPVARVEQGAEAIEARFGFHLPGPGAYSIAAEVDLRGWRPAAWGFVEAEPQHILLRADLVRADAS